MKRTKTPRYDWNELKLKFFVSRQESVRGFLEDEMGMKENGNSRKMTLGWSEERENFRWQVFEQAKEKLSEDLIDGIYKPSIEELGNMHKEIIDILKLSISYIKDSCIWVVDWEKKVVKMPDTQELSRIWKMIRFEKEQSKQVEFEEKVWTVHEDSLWE